MRSFVYKHFLDSGAFSLYREAAIYRQQHPQKHNMAYYDSARFYHYMDSYARFIHKFERAIDHYANLDVIGHPKLSWRNLKYLEDEHDLHPIPVIHAGTDLQWLHRHLKHGYRYIGIGGLVTNTRRLAVKQWVSEFFRIVCPAPTYMPLVKVHSFGMASGPLLSVYPFYSADATNVGKLGWFGKIIIPQRARSGSYPYDFSREATVVALSPRVKSHKLNFKRLNTSANIKRRVQDWLDYINAAKYFNRKLSFTNNEEYKAANLFFYKEMLERLPEWPFPLYQQGRRKGLL